jgi:hypothetical protein
MDASRGPIVIWVVDLRDLQELYNAYERSCELNDLSWFDHLFRLESIQSGHTLSKLSTYTDYNGYGGCARINLCISLEDFVLFDMAPLGT